MKILNTIGRFFGRLFGRTPVAVPVPSAKVDVPPGRQFNSIRASNFVPMSFPGITLTHTGPSPKDFGMSLGCRKERRRTREAGKGRAS